MCDEESLSCMTVCRRPLLAHPVLGLVSISVVPIGSFSQAVDISAFGGVAHLGSLGA